MFVDTTPPTIYSISDIIVEAVVPYDKYYRVTGAKRR